MHTLTPRPPPHDPEVEALLDRYPRQNGELLGLFRVFARSPRLLAKLGAAGLLDRDSPLTLAERETVILRVTARLGCEYEWGVHVTAFGRAAGFSPAQLEGTQAAEVDPALWPAPLELLLRVVDALLEHSRLPDELRDALQTRFETPQQLEVFALVGFYHTVSSIAGNAELPLEPWAARFSAAR